MLLRIGLISLLFCTTLIVKAHGDQPVLLAQAPQAPQANPQANPAAPERYWTTQWSFSDIDVGKLASRLSAIGIDLGLQVNGNVSVAFDVGIPITSLRDGAKYRLDGKISSKSLVVDDVRFQDFSALIQYRDGVAKLESLRSIVDRPGETNADQVAGRIQGSGSLELVPRKDATAKLRVSDIAIAPIVDLVSRFIDPNEPLPIQGGLLSGDVSFSVAIDQLSDVASYELSGNLTANDIQYQNLPTASGKLSDVTISGGRLSVPSFTVTATDGGDTRSPVRLMGNLDLPLKGGGAFRIQIAGDDLPTETVLAIVQPSSSSPSIVAGKLDLRATATGDVATTVSESKWNVQASLASPSISVGGVDVGVLEHDLRLTPQRLTITPRQATGTLPADMRLQSLDCEFDLTDEQLVLQQVDAAIFGGQFQGNATVPLQTDQRFAVDATFQNIRPSVDLPLAGGKTTRLTGSFSGDVQWNVAADAIAKPVAHSGNASFTADEIFVGSQSIGNFKATLSADQGALSLDAFGKLFDGQFRVETASQMESDDKWSDLGMRMNRLQLTTQGIAIESLLSVIESKPAATTGRVSADIRVTGFDHDSNSVLPISQVAIVVQLNNIYHQEGLLTRNATLRSTYDRGVLTIESLLADYAQGNLRVSGRVRVIDSQQKFSPQPELTVSAARVELSRALSILGPFAADYQGRVSGSVTVAGTLDAIRIRGNVLGRDLKLYAQPLGNAHSGFAAEINTQTRAWRLRFPSVGSNVGGGELQGELALSSARRATGGIDMDSRWQLRRVDFVRLSDQLGRSISLAKGELTGEITIGGKSISSIDDMVGRFRFRLGDTQGSAIPGLISVGKFLGPISLATETFDTGLAVGIIGQGIVTLDEFWIGSDTALVQADGRVYMRSGRMDLNALIATGDYRDISANFAQLAQRYALRSLLPTSAILSVSELLRDRTLVIRVMGTVQNPLVRLQPVETFREESVRFILREGQRLIVGAAAADAFQR
ncbi:AsmA-like C-terminal region-containing protein [Stieleria varia]|uniref:AsmA-like C-terminal region-containing protein n=1 Tax=Stieleria varia TaxID=2528005 RepID=UPI0018D26051|nr:AsmA-like C-terminal region-containing protein [Stieleria varia]